AFTQARRKRATWPTMVKHIAAHGIEPWLLEPLRALAVTVAGALNMLGLSRVIVTGAMAELPPIVVEELDAYVRRACMWSRFGDVRCAAAPRRRAAGLITAAVDRVLLPRPVRSPQLDSTQRESASWLS